MFKVNEYFDGKVKSLGFNNGDGRFTVGVMAAGSYTFGTNCKEEMTLVSGKMAVNAFNPDGSNTPSNFGQRLVRTHANCLENLPLQAAVPAAAPAAASAPTAR